MRSARGRGKFALASMALAALTAAVGCPVGQQGVSGGGWLIGDKQAGSPAGQTGNGSSDPGGAPATAGPTSDGAASAPISSAPLGPIRSTVLGVVATTRVTSLDYLGSETDQATSAYYEKFKVRVEVRDVKGAPLTGLAKANFKAYLILVATPTPYPTATAGASKYQVQNSEIDIIYRYPYYNAPCYRQEPTSVQDLNDGNYDVFLRFNVQESYCSGDLKDKGLAVVVGDDFETAKLSAIPGLPTPRPQSTPSSTTAPGASPTPTPTSTPGAERYAGTGYPDKVEGARLSAQFNNPVPLAAASDGTLYVGDRSNYCIRKITPSGTVSTLSGSGSSGYDNGTSASAKFSDLYAMALDSSGNLIVADRYRVRKVTPTGTVTTIAGGGQYGYDSGYRDDIGTDALFKEITGVTVANDGTIYVADTSNNKIRKVKSGTVSLLAGSSSGEDDGTGSASKFYQPMGLALDSAGNIIVADNGTKKIRKVTPSGVVTTIAKLGSSPTAVAVLSDGSIVAQTSHTDFYKVSADGKTITRRYVSLNYNPYSYNAGQSLAVGEGDNLFFTAFHSIFRIPTNFPSSSY